MWLELSWDLLGPPGDKDERNQADQHSHGAEGKQLRVGLLIIARIVYESRQPQDGLSARQPNEERNYVGRQAAIGVAVLLEVHHHQQLREENNVDQVRAHGPASQRADST